MSLRINIENVLKKALKEKDKILISTLRLVVAAIKDKDIASRTADSKDDIKDEEIKVLLKKMIKQRNESIEIYKKNNRNDLLEIEEKEVSIITEFLPKQLSEEETLIICKKIIDTMGATSIKDMGRVMGALKKDYNEVLDFAKAGAILRKSLK